MKENFQKHTLLVVYDGTIIRYHYRHRCLWTLPSNSSPGPPTAAVGLIKPSFNSMNGVWVISFPATDNHGCFTSATESFLWKTRLAGATDLLCQMWTAPLDRRNSHSLSYNYFSVTWDPKRKLRVYGKLIPFCHLQHCSCQKYSWWKCQFTFTCFARNRYNNSRTPTSKFTPLYVIWQSKLVFVGQRLPCKAVGKALSAAILTSTSCTSDPQ